jgi:hypothetical protein
MPELTPGTAVVLESEFIQRLAQPLNGVEASSIVKAWHDLNHEGVFRFCPEQPCHALHYKRRR